MIRILVVDDKTALVELVQSYLESEQYEVLTADDGRAALEPLEGQFAEKGLLLHSSCLKADEVALPCVPIPVMVLSARQVKALQSGML